MTKEVAKKTEQFLQDRPEWMGDESKGNEDVKSDDLAIPRLSIAQDLSPHIKPSKPEYIEGCKAGMCFNSATGQLYGQSTMVVPVLFRKEHIIWRDRKKGGGFEGSYHTIREANHALSQLENPHDCAIVDTAVHFCLLVGADGSTEQVVMSMSKSQMKPSRAWNTKIVSIGGNRWSKVYTVSVVGDSNKNGDEYYNWRIDPIGYVSQALNKAASSFYDSLKDGEVKVNYTDEKVGFEEDDDAEF